MTLEPSRSNLLIQTDQHNLCRSYLVVFQLHDLLDLKRCREMSKEQKTLMVVVVGFCQREKLTVLQQNLTAYQDQGFLATSGTDTHQHVSSLPTLGADGQKDQQLTGRIAFWGTLDYLLKKQFRELKRTHLIKEANITSGAGKKMTHVKCDFNFENTVSKNGHKSSPLWSHLYYINASQQKEQLILGNVIIIILFSCQELDEKIVPLTYLYCHRDATASRKLAQHKDGKQWETASRLCPGVTVGYPPLKLTYQHVISHFINPYLSIKIIT